MRAALTTLGIVLLLALCGTATTVTLLAGQHYNAGWVDAYAQLNTLTIEIVAENGWVLEETHVYVGTEPPRKSAPGRFPYKHERLPANATTDSYEIALDDYDVACLSDLYIAVHAVVNGAENEHGEETAWGEGSTIRSRKNWAMYFTTPVFCSQTY